MILTELTKLYDRLAEDEEFIPPLGWSIQNAVCRVVLTRDGHFFGLQDMRIEKKELLKCNKEKLVYAHRRMILPGYDHSSGSGATPRFLWDKAEYMFGYAKTNVQKAKDVLFPSFKDHHLELQKKYSIQDEGYLAVCKFLSQFNPNDLSNDIKEKLDDYGFGACIFYIQGTDRPVFESLELKNVWQSEYEAECQQLPRACCLVTGKKNSRASRVIEPKIKLGEKGGAAIACCKDPAYESYGKKQTFNSPISVEAGTKAYNALNFLLLDDRFHLKVAGTTVVFWTGKKTNTEGLLGMLFGSSFGGGAVDEALQSRLKILWKIIAKAGDPDLAELGDDASTPFYMLGIEPNAARVVIRFWHESTLGDLIVKLRRHHEDMAIEKCFDSESDHIPLWLLIRQTARDSDGVPPLLSGALLRSVIEGLPYPTSLYQLVLNRINVSHRDQNGKYRVGGKVTYEQAAVVKGFLTRNTQKGEIKMSMDTSNKTPSYLLGRLFATLEKTQGEALGDLNAGIGDKYYSAASATPRVVFPTLLDMFRKWVKKLGAEKKGLSVVRDKLVGEILDGIDSNKGFPANLSLDDRGMFALGYYQQMRTFFQKKDEPSVEEI